jgi:hypothetical protein
MKKKYHRYNEIISETSYKFLRKIGDDGILTLKYERNSDVDDNYNETSNTGIVVMFAIISGFCLVYQ